jgi:UPF0755 protein
VPGPHTRKHTYALIFIFIVVIIVGGAVLAGTFLWLRLGEPYKGYATADTFVDIPQGAGTAEIRRRLIDAGVIQDDATFRAALWWSGEARNLQAGEYRFDRAMTPVEVLQRIGRGDVFTQRITFPEGLTIVEMARLYESREFGTAKDFLAAAGDPTPVEAIDPAAPDLEGYLFPDTYALPRRTPASRLVAMMVDRFLETYTEDLRAKAQEQGLTTRQVVTIASLVEKETAKADEHPLVAAVYRNRLQRGMPMQADPTVIYALQKAGRYDGNIRREDLQFDSPYNTYRYPGLPPGPIAAPGRAALQATVAPADVPYLYFVSRNDGSHVFAETLAQHNANVQEWQVLYFRRQRQAQRDGRP